MTGNWVVTCAALALMLSSFDVSAQPGRCDVAEYREFDFWVGDWTVETADGQHAGTNRIELQQSGCLLVESWNGAKGGTGTSMNFYNAVERQWRQLWVSPGAIIDIAGGLTEDGAMRLTGSIYYASEGVHFPFRGRWSKQTDGSVVQFFEEARSPGEWKPWFRGVYRRADAN